MKKAELKKIEQKEKLILKIEKLLNSDDSHASPGYYNSFFAYKLVYDRGVEESKIMSRTDDLKELVASNFLKLDEKGQDIIRQKEKQKKDIYDLVKTVGMIPEEYNKYMSRELAYNNSFSNNYDEAVKSACDYILNEYTRDYLDMLKEKGKER